MFQTVDINIVPTGDMPVVNVSQYDVNRIIRFCLLNDGETYTPTNFLKAEFIIRKVDGTLFTQETTILVSNVLELVTTEQMTACAGKNIGEIRLTFNDPDIAEDDVIISTLNFILDVERSPETGGIESESEIANLDGQIAAIVDEQLDNYYTKSEIDDQIETIVSEQVTPIVSGIVAEQVPPAVQAELGNYYTKDETDTYFYNKTETDTLLSGKADVSLLPDMTTYYTKTETDTLLSGKVSNSTLNDYYTKTQVDTLISGVGVDIITYINTPAAVQTFTDGGDNIPMKSCEVAIVAQQASGTPSPSNPLPITGFSSVGLTVVGGKNLFGGTFDTFYPLHFSVDTQIKVSANVPTSPTVQFAYYDINQNRIDYWGLSEANSNISNRVAKALTLPKETYYVKFINSQSSDYQIELGNVNTTFEAYKGTTIPVSLGQTIYGGTAELVGGNGTKTHGYVDLGDYTWTYTNGRMYTSIPDLKPIGTRATPMLCSFFQVIDDGRPLADVPNNSIYTGASNTTTIYVNTTDYTDPAAFKTWVTGQKLVYPITPTAFTFTDANIPTLSGVNNVYADSGDINSLEYLASIGKILLG